MKINTDLRCILTTPFVYDFYQEIVGGNKLRCNFVADYVRAKPGDKVVDIGCGPAQLLRWLPELEYIGFDTNKAYIAMAQKKYGHRGLFLVGDTKMLENDQRLLNTGIVICCGILHHLDDDEVFHVVKFAYKILKAGGRLVRLDPCWAPHQGFFEKWMLAHDRGQHIRTEQGYRRLIERVFPNFKTTSDLKPITRCVNIECVK